jgi:hypothetical protein
MPKIEDEHAKAEQVFVDQAAHLLLALAGLKSLPKQKPDVVESELSEIEQL